ncbi:unnamed protein product [marine sediment metagenome]|uniref:2TM domain-containing protein n=1 Tax=marine sediment metagenome TaxID=412755 RepID=X1TKP1_9ZZZZ
MSHSDWIKIEFQEFVNKFNIELVIQKAPKILYSKKDKEHVAENSLIAAILIAGLSLIYIAISVILMPIYPINTFIFYPVLGASGMAIGWFTYNYYHLMQSRELYEQ